jgi:hypothetical protein
MVAPGFRNLLPLPTRIPGKEVHHTGDALRVGISLAPRLAILFPSAIGFHATHEAVELPDLLSKRYKLQAEI